MFNIEFFTKASGKSPVEDYINDQHSKVRNKIYRTIQLLKQHGFALPGKHLKRMAGAPNLWELRVKHGSINYRIFLAKVGNNIIILLHIITKKRQKTSSQDIDTALDRLKSYKQLQEGNIRQ